MVKRLVVIIVVVVVVAVASSRGRGSGSGYGCGSCCRSSACAQQTGSLQADAEVHESKLRGSQTPSVPATPDRARRADSANYFTSSSSKKKNELETLVSLDTLVHTKHCLVVSNATRIRVAIHRGPRLNLSISRSTAATLQLQHFVQHQCLFKRTLATATFHRAPLPLQTHL